MALMAELDKSQNKSPVRCAAFLGSTPAVSLDEEGHVGNIDTNDFSE